MVSLALHAQKLPNVQTISLRAPAGVKIDGKTKEWNNRFQCYNHATSLFYTIANDDENLYLVIKAIDRDICKKIIGGGITLTFKRQMPEKITTRLRSVHRC
jgi:hypothetical protein